MKDSYDSFMLKWGHKPHLEFQTAESATLPIAVQVPFLALQDLEWCARSVVMRFMRQKNKFTHLVIPRL